MQYADTYSDYVSYELEKDEEVVSSGTVLFAPPKHFHFVDPKLSVEVVGEQELLVTAKAYAKSIEIINGDDSMLLEDNYFDMNPGTRKIRVLKGKPENLKIRSVFDIR